MVSERLGIQNPSRPLKLKAILISTDNGKTWSIARQYYLVDIQSDEFIDLKLIGAELLTKEKDSKDYEHSSQSSHG